MDTRSDDGRLPGASTDQRQPIDPLRRVFEPIEKRQLDGTSTRFQTVDGVEYTRDANGVIRRKK